MDRIKVDSDDVRQSQQMNGTGPNEKSIQRISQIFALSDYSKLVEDGETKVYLLNASENKVSNDLRWFTIGEPSKTAQKRDHKVIILMGATGSGKSTLINGMVNYILGVQWEDPFRFKCVREDESVSRNQAHSQTSSVTAYTIYHKQGMAVPYSITLIDTPGYGDTRGVARDKEITQLIHRFLTSQETHIKYLHAACFVAASSNSRLTVTQRYIIDSVLSIFGKDIKENIRLLVTFADNADPPVVEACRVAQFPVTSQSAGITYSKFNSSVLYASNKENAEEDFSIDQLFWDMGQENFEKFFKMLDGMEGKDLESTREVISHRQTMEQSMKDIERALEFYFLEIENMDLFLMKLRKWSQKVIKKKDEPIEKMEARRIQVKCEKGYMAFNCCRCKTTCVEPTLAKNTDADLRSLRQCRSKGCSCPGSEHTYERLVWRVNLEKVDTTIAKMKLEYQAKYKKGKIKTKKLIDMYEQEMKQKKMEVINLLEQMGIAGKTLDSKSLRSKSLSPSDYLSLMKSRVAEEQKPGYLIRLETLAELQQLFEVKSKEGVDPFDEDDCGASPKPARLSDSSSDQTENGKLSKKHKKGKGSKKSKSNGCNPGCTIL